MSWTDDFQLPDAPYPHQPTDHGGFDPVRLTYEERALLGEITAYGAIIEQIAVSILRGVRFGPRNDGWSTDEERYGRGMRLSDILRLIKVAGTTHPDAAKWAINADAAMNERHEFVHTAWIIRIQSLGLMFGPRLNPTKPTSSRNVEDLLEVRDRLRAVWASGRDVSRSFSS